MDINQKEHFLYNEYLPELRKINYNTVPAWGKLSFQGMVEHMSDAFGNASGKIHLPLVTTEDKLEQYKTFAVSDRPFKENTVNALMSTEPPPLRHTSITEALLELEMEIAYFKQYFSDNPLKTNLNPFFGVMNYEEWIHLLFKHAWHHLRQFGVINHPYNQV